MLAINLDENLMETLALDVLRTQVNLVNVNYSELIAGKLTKAEILFTKLKYQLNVEVLSKLPDLKFIISPTTGLDHIDLEYCKSRKIEVISIKNRRELLKDITSTSEIAWWHILELNRKVSKFQSLVENSIWDRHQFIANSLRNKALGVCGYGRLGRQMVKIGQAFGMSIHVYEKDIFEDNSVNSVKSLAELFRVADILTLHIDANHENFRIVNHEILENITKEEFFLINTSRGSVVDENAIIHALEMGKLSGYGTDVLNGETSGDENWLQDNPIWVGKTKLNLNISLTPHIGGATQDSLEKVETDVINQLLHRLKN